MPTKVNPRAQRFGSEDLEARLAALYPGQAPKHWGTVMRYADGGPDPLDGVSAYRSKASDHWHYVSFGFSELSEKRSNHADVSGWGFELTFRLKAGGETEPPMWPVLTLQKLARYVFNNKAPFEHAHYIAWGGPITKEEPTKLEALVFMIDPELETVETCNGSVTFLTVIGITSDEHGFAASATPEALLEHLTQGNPLGITEIGRRG